MKLCNIKICYNKHYAKNLCKKHYYQKWNEKNPEKRRKIWNTWNRLNPNKSMIWQKANPDKVFNSIKKRLKKYGKQLNMTSLEYFYAIRSWSETIKKLDNYMCKNCDSKDNLNAHHIMPKNDFPELSLDLDNGIVLCDNCHGELHGFEIY